MKLVTGASGLLGAHVSIELLKAGQKVRALKRVGTDLDAMARIFNYYGKEISLLFSEIQWVEGDLENYHSLLDAMEGIDDVYHCAAYVSFNPLKKNKILSTNIDGTGNMVNASLEKKIQKFCHVSSIATLGTDHEPITEETHWKSSPQNSIYAISKYGAEREVWRAIEEGLNAVIVNPSVILGPGNSQTGSSALFKMAQAGLKFYTEGITGFVDVRDVARIMIRLTEKNVFKQRFILSSENISYHKFFDIANSSFGKPKPLIKTGKIMSKIAWRAARLKAMLNKKEPAITRETADAALQKRKYSNDKIKSLLHYSFLPVEESILETSRLLQT